MRNIKLVLYVFIFAVFAATSAGAEGWIASKVSQPARFTTDNKKWTVIKPGMSLPKASWVHVGARGRLLLRRGKETIFYRANTLTGLIQRSAGKKTELRQQFGSMLVDVETRNRKHTTVKTPFLAAVVKGTRFEVNVGRRNATVRVEQGTVEVSDPIRGERADVRSGQSVDVNASANRSMQIKGPGPKSPVVTIRKTKPVVPVVPANAAAGSNAAKQKTGLSGVFSRQRSNNSSSGNSNGNGNGNSNGNGNGNSNGNGNGNSNGNGNGNSNGNGNGNSNGNGNGNSNGNGNGNSNGNGNGNSNGNGNGNGNN